MDFLNRELYEIVCVAIAESQVARDAVMKLVDPDNEYLSADSVPSSL